MIKCEKCGKELNFLEVNNFKYDGSDSWDYTGIFNHGDGIFLDLDSSWCGYEVTEEEQNDCIRCPYCNDYPFVDTEIQVYDIVRPVMFTSTPENKYHHKLFSFAEFLSMYNDFKNAVSEKYTFDPVNFELCCFYQTFPNTAGIFANGGISGQKFTDNFISVFIDADNNFVQVYGDNTLVYTLDKPNCKFYEDLKNKNLKPFKHIYSYISS